MLSHLLAVTRVTSMGVFILLQEEPGKMPQSSGLGTTQQRPRLPPSSPGSQPMSCFGSQPLPGQSSNPGGLWEADVLAFPPPISMCFGSPTPAVPVNGQVPRGEAPLGEGALHVPDLVRAQNWPVATSSSYPRQLHVRLPVCKWPEPPEHCP